MRRNDAFDETSAAGSAATRIVSNAVIAVAPRRIAPLRRWSGCRLAPMPAGRARIPSPDRRCDIVSPSPRFGGKWVL
ncbi:hypothetical protein AQ611_23285 [Burkholderia singularis]|nr:hypothetical protein AQ611_23285 [Burkholderia sp. Bp7605]